MGLGEGGIMRQHPALVAASLLYLVAVVVQTLVPDPLVGAVATAVRILVWLLFAGAYAVQVARSGRPVAYVLGHPLQLLVLLVPGVLVALVLARALLGAAGAQHRAQQRAQERAQEVVRRTVVTLAVVATTLVLLLAAAVLIVERGAEGALIVDYGGAVWWAFVTVATVGYGDLVPVTAAGRALAVGGMLLGIGVIGTLTAGIAAHVTRSATASAGGALGASLDPAGQEPAENGADTPEASLTLVLEELRALRVEVADLRAGSPGREAPAPGPHPGLAGPRADGAPGDGAGPGRPPPPG